MVQMFAKQAETQKVQDKVLMWWINQKLKNKSSAVQRITHDLRTGLVLSELFADITNRYIPSDSSTFNKTTRGYAQKCKWNIEKSIMAFQDEGVIFKGIGMYCTLSKNV